MYVHPKLSDRLNSTSPDVGYINEVIGIDDSVLTKVFISRERVKILLQDPQAKGQDGVRFQFPRHHCPHFLGLFAVFVLGPSNLQVERQGKQEEPEANSCPDRYGDSKVNIGGSAKEVEHEYGGEQARKTLDDPDGTWREGNHGQTYETKRGGLFKNGTESQGCKDSKSARPVAEARRHIPITARQ